MQKFNYRPASVTVTLPDKKYIMKLAQNLMLFHTVMVGSVGSITIELQRAGTFTVTLAIPYEIVAVYRSDRCCCDPSYPDDGACF